MALGVVTTSKVGSSGPAPGCLEAVRCASIIEGLGAYLAQCRLGTLGRRNRIALRLGLVILVTEQERPPGLEHVPLHIVSEHAEEDVGPDPVLETVSDGPHLEIQGLERAKRTFDLDESLVAANGIVGTHALLRETPQCRA